MRKIRYQRRESRSAIWALRFGIFAAVLLLIGFLMHRFLVLETPDLLLIVALSAVLSLLAILCAIKGFRNLWINGDKGGVRSFWGASLALLVQLPLISAIGLWYSSPQIYDVSTDYQSPPQLLVDPSARLPRMNPITPGVTTDMVAQMSAYPDVLPRHYRAAPDRVVEGVETVLKDFGWKLVRRSDQPLSPQQVVSFSAIAHSLILGLTSDVVIRLQDQGETTLVDMRAISQYGMRDMGLNAAFITEFMKALEAEVNKAPADAE